MEADRFYEWCRTTAKNSRVDWVGEWVDVDGELIHYMAAGSGPPLLLLHGFMAWSFTWRHNIEDLGHVAYVVAPDFRGHGLSRRDHNRGHSLDDQVELVRGFLDRIGIEQVTICGHSMGGEVALRFALKYPGRVKALILVSASGFVSNGTSHFKRLLLQIPVLNSLLVRSTIMNRRFALRSLYSVYFEQEKIQPADVRGYMLPMRVPGSMNAILRVIHDLDFGRSAKEFREIIHKCLLVWGDEDAIIPLAHGDRLSKELSQAQFVRFPGCGHVPHEECPALFNETIRGFLHELDQPQEQ
jgi:pimeloyl-ACP methyl ester carboxylesterase